ncbi:MAG TPA: condensation domain-containing protein, partial [Candidatus Binatus sp.]|nr:condensation domain-containing protein [Candidatus Binatus sp.]
MASDAAKQPPTASVTDAKRRLLAQLRKNTGKDGSGEINKITPRPCGSVAPLSFAQERLWFLQQWEPSPVYNVARACRLKGTLDAALLERCVSEIIQRHQVLRTVFANVGDQSIQQILPLSTPVLRVIDLRPLRRSDRAAEINRRVAAE